MVVLSQVVSKIATGNRIKMVAIVKHTHFTKYSKICRSHFIFGIIAPWINKLIFWCYFVELHHNVILSMLLDMLFHFLLQHLHENRNRSYTSSNNIEDSYYLVCIVHSKKVIPKDDGIDSYLRLISRIAFLRELSALMWSNRLFTFSSWSNSSLLVARSRGNRILVSSKGNRHPWWLLCMDYLFIHCFISYKIVLDWCSLSALYHNSANSYVYLLLFLVCMSQVQAPWHHSRTTESVE